MANYPTKAYTLATDTLENRAYVLIGGGVYTTYHEAVLSAHRCLPEGSRFQVIRSNTNPKLWKWETLPP
jgi:hypothetical protein